MPYMTVVVDGGTLTIPVRSDSGRKGRSEFGGSSERCDTNGTLRSTRRWEKRNWPVVTAPMLESDVILLENAIALGAFAVCNGYFNRNAGVTVEMEIVEDTHRKVQPSAAVKHVLSLELKEV